MSIQSRSQRKARRMIKKALGNNKLSIANNISVSNDNRFKHLQVYNHIRLQHPFLKGNLPGNKFFPAIIRMHINNELVDPNTLSKFNTVMELLIEGHLKEYDINLNNMSVSDILNRFTESTQLLLEDDIKKISKKERTRNPDYDIVRIDSGEEAQKYSEYTEWCIVKSNSSLNSYNYGGCGQFYFCIKKGFEDIERSKGLNAPLDEYGLSMIAVCVDIPSIDSNYAALKSCTCRWNHTHGGNDAVLNTEEISDLLGVNFYEEFKPNDKWLTLIKDIQDKLENSDLKLTEIFKDGSVYDEDFESQTTLVSIKSKYNFIKNRKFISGIWFDRAHEFSDGFAEVNLKDRGWSFINLNGEFISNNNFFVEIKQFSNNVAAVKIKDKGWTFINTQGEFITDKFFKSIQGNGYSNGFCGVELESGKWSFIDLHGKFITNKTFKKVVPFSYGIGGVQLEDSQWTYIDTNGKFITNEKFKMIYSFVEKLGVVYSSDKENNNGKDKGWNIMSTDGKLLSSIYFKEIFMLTHGFFGVQLFDDTWTFVDTNGKLIPNRFKSITSFTSEGFALVEPLHGEEKVKIDKHGNIINEELQNNK